jgi:hypothetical protein
VARNPFIRLPSCPEARFKLFHLIGCEVVSVDDMFAFEAV